MRNVGKPNPDIAKIGKSRKNTAITQIIPIKFSEELSKQTPTKQKLEKVGKMRLLVKLWQRNIENGLETKPLQLINVKI